MDSKILVVIPAYNEEKNIGTVVERLKGYFKELDYVIINDGSVDATKKICMENNYNIVNLPVNLGLSCAFQTGMRYAFDRGYEYVVQFDGDNQHRPEYIMPMKEAMDGGFDVVIVSRFLKDKKPFSFRMIGSRLISLAIGMTTGVRLTDPTSGMRMYNKRLIEEFALRLNYAPEPDTISYLIKQGSRICEIGGQMDEREGGVSYLTPVNAVKYMLRMLTSILFIQNFRKR